MEALGIIERTPQGTAFRDGAKGLELRENEERISGNVIHVSPTMGWVVSSTGTEVRITRPNDDAAAGSSKMDLPGVVAMDVSPAGKFLTVFQRPTSSDKQAKNLKVFSTADLRGAPVFEQTQKSASKDAWPVLQFDECDEHMYRGVANEVHQFQTCDFGAGIARRARVQGVSSFAPNPRRFQEDEFALAVYCAESKGSPASVQVFGREAVQEGSGDGARPITRRSFFRSSGGKLMWNAAGTAVLALAFSDVDKTNQSYYGEQSLFFLSIKGGEGFDAKIETKEGPIHDVAWSPQGKHFCVVHGFMPAKTTLFDDSGKPTYDLGSGARNMCLWSPFGRFLAVAGFGNLPGDVEVYDKKADGKLKLVGKIRLPDTVQCLWAPDGRHLLAATTSPRLRVDNKLVVFTYAGEKVWERPVDVLLEAAWVPAPPGTFQDRPASPEVLARQREGKVGAAAGAGPAKAYVPPHLKHLKPGAAPRPRRHSPATRFRCTGSPVFSMGFDREESAPGKIRAGGSAVASRGPGDRLPPGADPVVHSKSASKNAKRRARAKKKQEQAAAEGTGGGEAKGEEAAPPPAPPAAVKAETVVADDPAARQKKLRGLQKKLRQVEQLKDKPKDSLTPEQVQKLEGEAGIRAAIAELQV